MGFEDNLAFEAAQKYPLNLQKATHYILNHHSKIKHENEALFEDIQCLCKSATDCSCVRRIQILLQLYNDNMNKSQSQFINIINKSINDKYKIDDILNDYIHIIHTHSDNLEEICNKFNIHCKLDNCNGLRRNRRNDINESNKKNNHNEIGIDDMVMIDILDQIHSYLLHSFDTGYKLTKDERGAVMEEHKDNDAEFAFTKMTKLLTEKRQIFDKLYGKQNNSKFVTKTHEKGDEEINIFIPEMNTDETETEIENKTELEGDDAAELEGDSSNIVYSFSYRFNYWMDKMEHYIEPIVRIYDLKEEILENRICKLSMNDFIAAEKKANIFIKSEYAKKLICSGVGYHNKSDTFYNGARISFNHLMVIILYCDYTLLSYKFSASFRAKEKNENIKIIKERHRNFYWFGRYLRELVEGFGKEISAEDAPYFHGISGNVTFTSTIAKFHHPMSTTKEIAVAQRFATNNGIIISVKMHQFEVPYFDCNWISKFGNEEESLFIGGIFPLQIANIINCITGEQYYKYLRAINIFAMAMDADYGIFNATEGDEEIIQSVINGNDDVSNYVLRLFAAYCRQKKLIKMDFCGILQYLPHLAGILLTDTQDIQRSFVNLATLRSLFPRCHTIQFSNILISKGYIVLLEEQLLSQKNWIGLQRIEIGNITTEATNITDEEKKEYAGKYDEIIQKQYDIKKEKTFKKLRLMSNMLNPAMLPAVIKEFGKSGKKKDDQQKDDFMEDRDDSSSDINDLDHKFMNDQEPNMNAKDVESAVKEDIVWDKLRNIVNQTKYGFEHATNFKLTLKKDDRFNRLIICRKFALSQNSVGLMSLR